MNTRIKGLGEVVLRVKDYVAMRAFYIEILGLEVLKEFAEDKWIFFKIAPGLEGHTRILALVTQSWPANAENMEFDNVQSASTPLHHFAFEIELADFYAEKERLENLGLTVTESTHAWCHWRSLYIQDPEQNTIELVAYDASVI